MYRRLREINRRPSCFEEYTAADLWTDEHTSAQMLALHLDGSVDTSSRRTEFLDKSAKWMVSRFGLATGRAVADFGCGPGLYTWRLAASGARVTGIDFSERSIRYARELALRQGQRVEHVHADYLDFETDERFDLVTMIMCDYCALSREQRLGLLDTFRTRLNAGGAVLLDVYAIAAFAAGEEAATYAHHQGGFWSPEPHFVFQNTFKYQAERVLLDKYTIVEKARTRVVFNWLQCFDREGLRNEIEGQGLVIEEVLGDVAGGPFDPASPEFAVIARKPR